MIGIIIDVMFEMCNGIFIIIKIGKLVLLDDKEGKLVGIYCNIGWRLILVVGNFDGDL